ncbi:carbohydrate sulfotransferase 3-like [Lytechinus variegatus]|uniref:carbohydrate sulfotransferase 3-like n=1 Tax=Lytechinus variegatus TaxID=7654 RepID=UPI001BB2A886|nr:carbohydrate sulfotransferase 3-like [Lytechinus variegatus]
MALYPLCRSNMLTCTCMTLLILVVLEVSLSIVCVLFRKQNMENPAYYIEEIPVIKAGIGDVRTMALDKPNEHPPFLVLMAQWRTGSTLLGQLFNQNPELFYIFEPLWPVTKLGKFKNVTECKEISRNIIRGFAKCEFQPNFVKVLRSWGGVPHNKGLCLNTRSCRMDSAEVLGNFCKSFKGRLATKLIRADLELLKPLVVEDEINLRIIHLVRDPRGVSASRIHYLEHVKTDIVAKVRQFFPHSGRLMPLGLFDNDAMPKYMRDFRKKYSRPMGNPTVQELCRWMRENTFSSASLPLWLRGRYLLIKYEDFAESPLTETQRIYDFIGMPLTRDLKRFVNETTHPKFSDTNTFGTSKNSKNTAKQWMNDLTVLEERQILQECLDVLQLLGYA